MIILKKGESNKVRISVDADIDLTGFSMKLNALGVEHKVETLKNGDFDFTYTPDQVAEADGVMYLGILTVLDANGDVYVKYRPEFRCVEGGFIEPQYQTIIVQLREKVCNTIGGGGDEPKDYATVRENAKTGAEHAARHGAGEVTDSNPHGMKAEDISDFSEKAAEVVEEIYDDSNKKEYPEEETSAEPPAE